ncbi:unnamed protein product, partial [Meganyctiphanes norvegica]
DEYDTSGLYITVLHEASGSVLSSTRHLQPYSELRRLIQILELIQPGRIVSIMTVCDLDFGLPVEVRSYLCSLGSVMCETVGRGMIWTWSFIKGGYTIAESLTVPPPDVQHHQIHVSLVLASNHEFCEKWPHSEQWVLRRRFCDQYEFFGDLCSCTEPFDLTNLNAPQMVGNQLLKTPIMVIASRVPAFYRNLKTVMTAEGFIKSRLEVF